MVDEVVVGRKQDVGQGSALAAAGERAKINQMRDGW